MVIKVQRLPMLIRLILLCVTFFPPHKKLITLTPPNPLPPFPFTHKAVYWGPVGPGSALGNLHALTLLETHLGICLLVRRIRHVPFDVL